MTSQAGSERPEQDNPTTKQALINTTERRDRDNREYFNGTKGFHEFRNEKNKKEGGLSKPLVTAMKDSNLVREHRVATMNNEVKVSWGQSAIAAEQPNKSKLTDLESRIEEIIQQQQ